MTTQTVNPVFLSALQLLTPYPWPMHVEALLQATWGAKLSTARHHMQALHALPTGLSVPTLEERDQSHWTAIDLDFGRAVRLTGRSVSLEWFRGADGLLLPGQFHDQLAQNGKRVDLRIHGDYRLVAGEAGQVLLHWMVSNQELIDDILDVDSLIDRIMLASVRSFYPVAKLLYPMFDEAFPDHVRHPRPITKGMRREEIKERRAANNSLKPIPAHLHDYYVHPDDAPVVRKVFDQAAVGLRADTPSRLHEFTLLYTPVLPVQCG